MREFIIATDSCCDFTAPLIEEMELTVVPLSVLLGAESFRNVPGEGPDPQTFYQRLERGESAQTSAPNVALFKELLRPHLVAGKDILFLAFSSALSATYQNATIAAAPTLSSVIGRNASLRSFWPYQYKTMPGANRMVVIMRPVRPPA